jgi:hexosaminidase
MMDPSSLLPSPRHFTPAGGTCRLVAGKLILLDAPDPQRLRQSAARVQRALHDAAGLAWEVTASWATPPALVGLTLRVDPGLALPVQGYRLSIAPAGISVTARDEAGVFYGACTLAQILYAQGVSGQPAVELDCAQVEDWPDFPVRGVMLDVSRDKVPTLTTTFELVDMLAGWKINQLQLYTEHTFAYRAHPEVWAEASPFTGEDILALDAYCRERHVELVPNQNSFGHLSNWLTHARYTPLAELTGTFDTPWGHTMEGPFSLCPLDPGSLALLRELYNELLPHFSSRQFNVGFDETIDVGQGRSKEACATQGAGRVYLDFLLSVYREVKARGRTMQFWGDIIVQHPELISELPRDTVALEWGYEADHPFDKHGRQFGAAGIPFYVCPGTSTWCSIAGRTGNALGNLLNAAQNGLKHGATGFLNTDWGDAGHWQVLPVSYLGYAAGAAFSWALAANHDRDMAATVSRHAFGDPSGRMGRVAYDMGNVYRAAGFVPHNGSALFWMLQWPVQTIAGTYPPEVSASDCWEQAVDQAIAPLSEACMNRSGGPLIAREYANTARLLRHAARRGQFAAGRDRSAETRRKLDADMAEIIDEYRALWLARNRPGGLADSVGRLEAARADYRE